MQFKKANFLWAVIGACLTIVSCDDDSPGPESYFIFGVRHVQPETEITYYLKDTEGDLTWSLTDTSIAEVVSASGLEAKIRFKRSGLVWLEVTNGIRYGKMDLTVASTKVSDFSVNYAGSGTLKNGMEDTIFFDFKAPLVELPVLTLNGVNPNDTSHFFFDKGNKALPLFNAKGEVLSDLRPYQNSDRVFYAIYKAGAGNGQPEARLESVKISDIYGGGQEDSLYVKLQKVDNIAPIGKIELSEKFARDSTQLTVTVTFNEPMRPIMATPADTIVRLNISGGGVKTVVDTLWATDDPAIWSSTYLTNGGGEGKMTVSVEGILDLGGNAPASLPEATLTIDNTPPEASGTVEILSDAPALSIKTSGQWLALESNAAAPTSVDDFSAGGTGDTILIVKPGTYSIYFIEVDEAGNVSEIVSGPSAIVPE